MRKRENGRKGVLEERLSSKRLLVCSVNEVILLFLVFLSCRCVCHPLYDPSTPVSKNLPWCVFSLEDDQGNFGTALMLTPDGTSTVLISPRIVFENLQGEEISVKRYVKHHCGCFTCTAESSLMIRDGTRDLWITSNDGLISGLYFGNVFAMYPFPSGVDRPIQSSDFLPASEMVISNSKYPRHHEMMGYPRSASGCIIEEMFNLQFDFETQQMCNTEGTMHFFTKDDPLPTGNLSHTGSPVFSTEGISGILLGSEGGTVKLVCRESIQEMLERLPHEFVPPNVKPRIFSFEPYPTPTPLPIRQMNSLKDVVEATTFRFEDAKSWSIGGTCFFVLVENGEVVLVSNRHVFNAFPSQQANVARLVLEECGCFGVVQTFQVDIRDDTEELWLASPTHDLAILPMPISGEQIKEKLGIDRLISESQLLGIDEVHKLSGMKGQGHEWGFPLSKERCLLKEFRQNDFDQIESKMNIANGIPAGINFLLNYAVPDSVGGHSGSPVYFRNSVIGVHRGTVKDENGKGRVSMVVPSEYLIDLIASWKSSR